MRDGIWTRGGGDIGLFLCRKGKGFYFTGDGTMWLYLETLLSSPEVGWAAEKEPEAGATFHLPIELVMNDD